MSLRTRSTLLLTALLVAAAPRGAQERGAVALDHFAAGIAVTGRVLVVGAFPGDEDLRLIAALTRTHRVETGYLSLTRGEVGLNTLGREGGDALGALRVQETLAARTVDGARQFFARAYDPGFARSAAELWQRWPREELVADMVAVIRAFRPQVIVSVHGADPPRAANATRDAADSLIADAFDAAADTARFPRATLGDPWTPAKLYGRRFAVAREGQGFDPVSGEDVARLAARAGAMHRSQLPSVGRAGIPGARGGMDWLVLRRRRGDASPGDAGVFDRVDTTLARFSGVAPAEVAAALGAVAVLSDSLASTLDLRRPWRSVQVLARVVALVGRARGLSPRCRHPAVDPWWGEAIATPTCTEGQADLDATLDVMLHRATRALLLASGVSLEVTAPRELVAYGEQVPVTLAVHNRGREPVRVTGIAYGGQARGSAAPRTTVPPDSTVRWSQFVSGIPDAHPWWAGSRLQGLHPPRTSPRDGLARLLAPAPSEMLSSVAVPADFRRLTDLAVGFDIGGTSFAVSAGPVMAVVTGPTIGEERRPVVGVPPVAMSFDLNLQWIRAGIPIRQELGLTLQSYSDSTRRFSLRVVRPEGLLVDAMLDTLSLRAGERADVRLPLRGRLAPGRYEFGVIGTGADSAQFSEGFRTISYPHIPPARLYRSSALYLQSVELTVPRGLSVAWVRNVDDGTAAYLRQLDIPVTELDPAELPQVDLARYSTVVLGPRVVDGAPALAAYADRLRAFVRAGGTLVLFHSATPTVLTPFLPYPLGWNLPAERVSDPAARVTLLVPTHRLLQWPNVLGPADWSNWQQERALFVPTVIDPRYVSVLEMHDPGERENRGSLLAARVGRGHVVVSSLALTRQLSAGVPGSARLLVNMLSSGLTGTPAAR
ncbi:MAG: PIG-L family deacetylase [Gemmatimonadetes bacterium]|nr:PIG-L family deacetylase [Gemmatimonadota bacterium]